MYLIYPASSSSLKDNIDSSNAERAIDIKSMTRENFLDMLKQGKPSSRNENSKSNHPSSAIQPTSNDNKEDVEPTQWGAVKDNYMLLDNKQMSLKVTTQNKIITIYFIIDHHPESLVSLLRKQDWDKDDSDGVESDGAADDDIELTGGNNLDEKSNSRQTMVCY